MKQPKYIKIYDQIVKNILTDKWSVGSTMKSENELIKQFNVSRLTIRNVLSILENEGRIRRSRGKKTLILDRLLRNSFNSEIKDYSVTINADYKLVDVQIVKNLFKKNFTSSTSLYYIERLRKIKNRENYLISKAYIPVEIIGEIESKKIFEDKNLLNVLIDKFQIKFSKSTQEISSILLDKNEAKIFNTTMNMPAISNTWYFYDLHKKLVLIDKEITLKPIKVINNYY